MALSKLPELHLWSTFEPTVLQCIKKITLRNQFIRKPLCWVWRWKLVNKNKSNIFSHTVAMHVWKSKKGTIQLVIWVNYAKLNCLESFVKKEKWFQIFTAGNSFSEYFQNYPTKKLKLLEDTFPWQKDSTSHVPRDLNAWQICDLQFYFLNEWMLKKLVLLMRKMLFCK